MYIFIYYIYICLYTLCVIWIGPDPCFGHKGECVRQVDAAYLMKAST